jgi:DNA primase
MVPRTNEHPYYKCFKCGEAGDIFELAKYYTDRDFRGALEFLCDEYGISLDGYDSSSRKPFIPRTTTREYEPEPENIAVDQTEFFKRAEENLDPTYLEKRGISLETQRHYHVGTIPNWIHPLIKERYESQGKELQSWMYSPRCIIPTSTHSYLARDTRAENEKIKKFMKQKYGQTFLFGKDDIKDGDVFVITEGEIDAMSIYEVSSGEVKGVGLGSTSNWRKVITMIGEGVIPSGVILALDNDNAGQECKANLKGMLDKAGIPNVVLTFEGKDPNDALKQDREALKESVYNALEELGLSDREHCLD